MQKSCFESSREKRFIITFQHNPYFTTYSEVSYETHPKNFIPDCEVTLLYILLANVRFVNVGKLETLTPTLEELQKQKLE